jgi:hypothetical protein
MHQLTGLSRATIVKSMSELRRQELAWPTEGKQQLAGGCESSEESNSNGTIHALRPYGTQKYRIRRPGGGRKLLVLQLQIVYPALVRRL